MIVYIYSIQIKTTNIMRKLIERILAVIGILGLLCAAVFIFVMPNVPILGMVVSILTGVTFTIVSISE